MTMAHITGVKGAVKSGVTEVLGIDNFSVDLSADPVETTDYLDDGYKSHISGNKSMAGTFEGNWDTAQDIAADPPNLNEGEIISIELYIDDAVPYKVSGDVLIQNVNISVPQADKARFTVTFVSDGAYAKDFDTP